MARRGKIKVMHGRSGVRIQEELDGEINVYGLDEWKEALAEREAGAEDIDATDSAIELARENNIDLSGVEGSGENGRILKRDVSALVGEEPEGEEPEDSDDMDEDVSASDYYG